jgi:hypothetical protein
MAKQLLNLRGVPEDEAGEVREFLERNRIDFYETPPNRWGLSAGAIWIRHDSDVPEAKRLMKEYQAERLQRARADYQRRLREGAVDTIWTMIQRDPLRFLGILAAVAFILFVMVSPILYLTG